MKNIPDDVRNELAELNLELATAMTLVVRLRGRLADVHDRLRQVYAPIAYDGFPASNEILCGHHVPLGDYCELCSREVRRSHCAVHDTDVIGACPYCAESHRLDTPEG